MPGATNGDEAIKHVGKRRIRISGRFFPQGAGAVVNSSNEGKAGWTVARSSQGLWTLTLDNVFLKLVPISCTLQLAAKDTWFAQFGVIDKAAKTVEIRVIDETNTLIDVAANANNSIGFEIEAVQDSVQG